MLPLSGFSVCATKQTKKRKELLAEFIIFPSSSKCIGDKSLLRNPFEHPGNVSPAATIPLELTFARIDLPKTVCAISKPVDAGGNPFPWHWKTFWQD